MRNRDHEKMKNCLEEHDVFIEMKMMSSGDAKSDSIWLQTIKYLIKFKLNYKNNKT